MIRLPQVRWLPPAGALGVVLLLGACQVDTVDHGKTACSEETCAGCCSASGVCLPGVHAIACGTGAAACQRCADALTCQAGACVDPSPVDAGPLPDKVPPGCGPATCAYGCCLGGTCLPFVQQGLYACGAAGAACGVCAAEATACDVGVCRVPACRLAVGQLGPFGTVAFGARKVGETTQLSLELRNDGDGICEVTAPQWIAGTDRNAFGFGAQTPQALTIEPLQSAYVPVSFTPYASKTWGGQQHAFTFTANDGAPSECASGQAGCRRRVLLGEGLASGLKQAVLLSHEEVALGPVAVGCSSGWKTLMLVNAGPEPVQLTSARVHPKEAGFELQPMALPLVIPPWGTAPLRVSIAPPAVAEFQGWLELEDSLSGPRSLPLRGEGTLDGHRVLASSQPAPADLDVLVVVHQGSGMAAVQQQLAAAAQSFLERAQAAGGEYRLGVIGSEGMWSDAGLLQGPFKFISAGNAAAFAGQLQVGEKTGAVEQSLEALRLATYPPLRTDVMRNGTFFRPGKRLGVLFVSNAGEASVGPELDDYLAAVRATSGEPAAVVAVLGGGQCNAGTRWRDAVTLFGGKCLPFSAAAGSLPQAFLQAADELFRPAQALRLPSLPQPGAPVTVTVDGVPLHSPAHYELDVETGTVRFGELWTPSPGAQLEVKWQAACGQ